MPGEKARRRRPAAKINKYTPQQPNPTACHVPSCTRSLSNARGTRSGEKVYTHAVMGPLEMADGTTRQVLYCPYHAAMLLL